MSSKKNTTAVELTNILQQSGTPYFELANGNTHLVISNPRSGDTNTQVVNEFRRGEWYSIGIFTEREIRNFKNDGFTKK